jgi:hypothetical protein
MIKTAFPAPAFQIREQEGKEQIFDGIRRRWVRLTPEEWVRQNTVRLLTGVLHYPAALIGIEKEIWVASQKKRFDLLVYNHLHQPWMLVECKAMDVDLTAQTLEQVLRYHAAVPVEFLVITNGSYTYGWQKLPDNRLLELEQLPAFPGGTG